jgi:CRISPR-associated protein Cas1
MILFIDTYGAFLHVADGMFEVRLKKDDEIIKRKIAPGKVNSILLSKGISLSTDAINLALTHNIDILFLEFDGTPYGRIWYSKLGSTTKIRKNQLIASVSKEGLIFVKEWLKKKLENQTAFLKRLKKHRPEREALFVNIINKITDKAEKIDSLSGERVEDVAESLRGYEGIAGKEYFRLLGTILPEQYKFETRSFRPARDSFNAFLNYAYGVLYGRVEKALLIAGIDPFVGFLHRDDYNQKSMVFDFIEQFRIYAEETVFKLFSAKKVNKKHTEEITGGISLNKDGKMLLMEAFTRFLDEERITYKNKHQTRENIMRLEAHAFAARLLKKKFKMEEVEIYDLLGDV